MTHLNKLARLLLVLTLAYNLFEAVVSVWSGFLASSIALVGFGFDSIIEACAASLVLWQFTIMTQGQTDETTLKREHFAHRFVGITFFVLAAYILYESGTTLWSRKAPEESIIGIIIAVLSLIVMPALAYWKMKVARQLGSRALESEAKETIACSILSVILLLGLGLNAWLGWWWADPVAGLCMIPWLILEGKEGFEISECCS